MPQPAFSGSPTTCTFGGLALPNGQGTLSNINLNDVISWFLYDVSIDHSNRSVGIQPQIARAKSVYVSDDFLNKTITLTLRYSEAVNPIGTALAKLSQAGEQQLSFDGSTYILAKYKGFRPPKLLSKFAPILWELDLEFICREPWFKDIASTTSATTTIVAAPTAVPTATPLAGGALAAGTYTLQYTYVTASGETAPSPATPLTPAFPVANFRDLAMSLRSGSRSTGSALQLGMSNLGARTRISRSYTTSRVSPSGAGVVLSGANLQISVGAVTFPSWATAVKWYFTGASPTTGFTVQNANGNAFTLNTAGNGTGPPTSTPATSFSITYAGSVFAEPVFSVVVPATNQISTLVLKNTMAAETLTITFPGNLIRATTITIDCGAWTITDTAGNSYDYSGSFPNLYGPAGQVNTFTAQLTSTPADAYSVTASATYYPRWES
jgi:hypothetical protein